jgi:type VI secretion system secreted protein Hcp
MPYSRKGIVLAVIVGGLALTAAVTPRGADERAGPDATASAAVTGYLRIEGFQGGATTAGYEGWMEVAGFEFGVTNSEAAMVGARTAGRPDFGPLTVVKPIDKATPLLAQACASGRHYPEAELVFFIGSSTTPSGSIKLSDIVISASHSGSGEAGPARETLSLNFGKVEWSYIDIDPRTGRPRGEVKAGWDVAANRAM